MADQRWVFIVAWMLGIGDDDGDARNESGDPDLEGTAFEAVLRAMPVLALVIALAAVAAFLFLVIVPDVQSSIRQCETQPV